MQGEAKLLLLKQLPNYLSATDSIQKFVTICFGKIRACVYTMQILAEKLAGEAA